MPTTPTFQRALLAALLSAAVALAYTHAQDATPAWTEKDSRLANQYIALLQQDPSYGQPVDLLWALYEKNNAVALLLEHFAAQSANPVARLVHGHLLRKSGDLEAAMAAYDDALAAVPDSRHALDAKTDLAIALDDLPAALETLARITALLPPSGPETAAHHLRVATFHSNNSDAGSAATSLAAAVGASPDDPALRARVADSYLGIGDLDGAISQFEFLAASSTPATKVNALAELARLHELGGDLAAAAAALESGMAATHFKHHLHREFFRRLVRLHERESNLPALQERLAAEAAAQPPSERALLAAATFAKLTVDVVATLTWQEKLHAAFPDDPVYHLDLATALVENDRLADAAESLDALIAKNPDGAPPLSLVLSRCEIDTKLGNREDATARLSAALARNRGDRTSEGTILDFAKTHYIDSVVLDVLAARALRDPSEPEHAFALARFHLERGRLTEAREAISRFVDTGNPAPPRLAGRLRQAADFFVAQDRPDTAEDFAARAADVGSDDPDSLLQLAEIAFARGDVPLAVSHLEAAIAKSPGHADRITLDSRILSYLQHNFHNEAAAADNSAFRIGSPLSPPASKPAAAPADARTRNYAPDTLGYAAARIAAASSDPTFDTIFRATWWAFRTDDFSAAYRSLRQLIKLRPETDLQTAKLALEIAASSGVYGLTKRQLQRLVTLDPENATNHIVRLAELELASAPTETSIPTSMPARAIELLEPLVSAGNLDTKIVESLARAYIADGHPSRALSLWERSFAAAPDPATRSNLLGPLAAEYLARNRTADAVDAYSRVIREHRDDKKRRELFAQQLSLASGNAAKEVLEQLVSLYRSLQNSDPLQPFWDEALARTLAKSGDTTEAFAAMKRAYYNNPDPDPGVLTELREMALELGDRSAALYFQRQLIFTAGDGAGPDEWQRLVGMLEERLDIGATDRARERLERRFGQDPDLLTGLLEHYQKTGQDVDALRVAGQLADLRPWDPAAQFRLGLLLRDAGKTRLAFDAFSAAIEQSPTDDAHDPGETPVVDVPHAAHLSSTLATDPFLTPSENHRTRTFLDQTVSALTSRPAVPTDPTQLQLAAVSAAAPLARELGDDTLDSWQTAWSARTVDSPHAAYRALAGSGAGPAAVALARDHLLGDVTEESYLRYAYALVSLKCWGDLVSWISEPDALTQHHGKRQRIASFVIAGLLRTTGPQAPGIDDIRTLSASGSFAPSDIWSFALAAGSGRNYEKATAIAAFIPAGDAALDPTQAYSVSLWNHWIGADTSSRDQLRTAFGDPLGEPAASRWFFRAFKTLESQTGDPVERETLTRNAASIATLHESRFNSIGRVRRRELDDRRESVPHRFLKPADLLRRLAAPELTVPAPPSPGTYPNRYLFWREAQRATSLYQTHGLGHLAQQTSDAVLSSLASPPTTDDDNYSNYLNFSADALVAKLRHAPAAEQHRLVSEALTTALSPEELYDFATILSNRGFPRHATGIFARLVEQNPTESNFVTEFTRTCHEAADPAHALKYFNRVLVARNLPGPKRMPVTFLADNYASFLRMTGDVESLETFAKAAPHLATAPAEPTGHELPYILALARLHVDAGDHAAAVPHFRAALGVDPDSTGIITSLAGSLMATGEYGAALEVLGSPPARYTVLPADTAKVLTARAKSLEQLGRTDELLPVLVDAHKLALAAPLVEIASLAGKSGHLTAATSALELARRSSQRPADRLAYASAALALTLSQLDSSPAKPQLLADRLAPALEALTPSQDALDSLLETLHTHAEQLEPAWQLLTSSGALARSRTNPSLAALARLAITAELDVPALSTPETSTTIATTAVHHLLDTGRPEEARRLLDALDAPRPPLRTTGAARVAVAAALGDDLTLRTLLAAGARGDSRSSRFGTTLPAAFADAGMPGRALQLYHSLWSEFMDTLEITLRLAYDNPSRRAAFVRDLDTVFKSYARLLIAEKHFAEAAELIPVMIGLSPDAAARITAELHVALGTPPENFLAATAPLGLTPGIRRAAALFHAESRRNTQSP